MDGPDVEVEVMVSWETTAGHEEDITAIILEKDLEAWKQALHERVAKYGPIQDKQLAAEDRCVETHRSQTVFGDVKAFFACIQAARDATDKALLKLDADLRKKVTPLIKRYEKKESRDLPQLPVGDPQVLIPTRRLDRFGFSREPLPDFVFVSAHPLSPTDRFLDNARVFYEEEWTVPTKVVQSFADVAQSLAGRKTTGKTACLVTHATGRNIMLPLLEGGHPSRLPDHLDAFLASEYGYCKFVLFHLSKDASVSSAFPQIVDDVVRYIRNTDRPFYNGLKITTRLEDMIVIHAIRKGLASGKFVLQVTGGVSRADLEHQAERVLDLMYDAQASALALGDTQRKLNDKILDWLNDTAGPIHTTVLDGTESDVLLRNLTATTRDKLRPLRRLRRQLTSVQQKPLDRLCVRGCMISRSALKSIARALGLGPTHIDAPNALFHGYVPPVIRPLYIEDAGFLFLAEQADTKATLDYWATAINVQPEVPEWPGATAQVRLDRYLDRALVLPGRTGDASVVLARVLPPEPGGTNAGTGRVAMQHYLQGMWDHTGPHQLKIARRAVALAAEWVAGTRNPICPVMADHLSKPPTQLLFVHDPEFAQGLITAR